MSPPIDLPEEIEALSKKLAKDPASRLFLPLAEKYRDAGFLDEAISVLQDGLKQHPTYTSAIFSLGRALHEKGDIDSALAKFQEVVKSAPDNLLAHKKMAEIRLKKNHIPEALESLRMVLILNPRDEEAQELVNKYEAPKDAAKAVSGYGDVALPEPVEETGHVDAIPAPATVSFGFLSGDDETDAYTSEPSTVEALSENLLETTSIQPESLYEIPLPEEITLDDSLGVEIPTTLTPAEVEPSGDEQAEDKLTEDKIDPRYNWAEPDVADKDQEKSSAESAMDILEVPVYEITEESGATGLKTPQPDDAMRRLFSEITWDQTTDTFDQAARMTPETGPDAEPEGEIETETLADLYIQQGHYNDALDIYNRLLRQNPEDGHLRQKLEELQFLISLLDQQNDR